MNSAITDNFPLQHIILQAESVRDFLASRRTEQIAPSLEAVVAASAALGGFVRALWPVTFDNLFRPGEESWTTVREYEEARNAARRLFFTAREAMEQTRAVAEGLRGQTGRKPEALDRLHEAIEDVGRLEEEVFRDWPSFAEALPPTDCAGCLPVDEAFAEIMGLTAQQVRDKVTAHKRKYYDAGGPKP